MHSYLRAIGFSKLEQKDLDQILQEVIVSCDEKKIAEQGKNEIFPKKAKEKAAAFLRLLTPRVSAALNRICAANS